MDSEAGAVLCAIQNLFKMDFAECEWIIDALAIERRRRDAAFRDLGEKPMATIMRMETSTENIIRYNYGMTWGRLRVQNLSSKEELEIPPPMFLLLFCTRATSPLPPHGHMDENFPHANF